MCYFFFQTLHSVSLNIELDNSILTLEEAVTVHLLTSIAFLPHCTISELLLKSTRHHRKSAASKHTTGMCQHVTQVSTRTDILFKVVLGTLHYITHLFLQFRA